MPLNLTPSLHGPQLPARDPQPRNIRRVVDRYAARAILAVVFLLLVASAFGVMYPDPIRAYIPVS